MLLRIAVEQIQEQLFSLKWQPALEWIDDARSKVHISRILIVRVDLRQNFSDSITYLLEHVRSQIIYRNNRTVSHNVSKPLDGGADIHSIQVTLMKLCTEKSSSFITAWVQGVRLRTVPTRLFFYEYTCSFRIAAESNRSLCSSLSPWKKTFWRLLWARTLLTFCFLSDQEYFSLSATALTSFYK